MDSEIPIAAIVAFDDQIEILEKAGIDLVFNIYREAGAGFASHVCDQIREQQGLPAENPAV